MITVNAMGDNCPIPVIKTKKAMAALTGPETIEVLVDNEIAVQNVTKMASSSGGKVTSEQWLNIHKLWHEKGRKSNATMLFGHVEDRNHRIDHMLRLRNLQDITGGFNAFIPLVYQTENNYLKVKEPLTGQEILKTYAIARILLDNIPNIKAYWATSTVKLALIAQEFGANDVDGTIEKEAIQSAAGASSANGIAQMEFVDLIKNSGFIPVERDSIYNEIKTW